MDKFPPIGHSYCVQCSTSKLINWSAGDFFSSYDEAVSYLSFLKIKYPRLVYRIVHCLIEIV